MHAAHAVQLQRQHRISSGAGAAAPGHALMQLQSTSVPQACCQPVTAAPLLLLLAVSSTRGAVGLAVIEVRLPLDSIITLHGLGRRHDTRMSTAVHLILSTLCCASAAVQAAKRAGASRIFAGVRQCVCPHCTLHTARQLVLCSRCTPAGLWRIWCLARACVLC